MALADETAATDETNVVSSASAPVEDFDQEPEPAEESAESMPPPAAANEETSEPTALSAEPPVSTSEPTPAVPDEPVALIGITDMTVDTQPGDAVSVAAEAGNTAEADSTIDQAASTTDTDIATSTAASTNTEADVTEVVDTMVTEQMGTGEASETVLPEGLEEGTATSTATSVPTQVDTVTNADNYYQFGREECVRVEGGSYYCGGITDTSAETTADGLFAAPDSDGDLEIYLRFDGVETKVTDNQLDDAAPYYDARSNTIVWHRLIDDRYQVISYDIENGTEKQLTHRSDNSMEPSRYGELTAWQTWNNNNWDIVIYDGRSETNITNSPVHDVAPLVYESYVLWNTTAGTGEQQIAMYDLEQGDTTLIQDDDGAAVRNPRMVLVYETANEHGDIITKGFDLASRTVVPLSATPRDIPSEIPESDQTGETRALIQNKSTGREAELLDVMPEPEPTASSTPNNASTTQTATATTTSPDQSVAAPELLTPDEIADVVIESYEPTATTSTVIDPIVHIEDVVIPPFSATSTD